MSAGSLRKCCEVIISTVSVISISFVCFLWIMRSGLSCSIVSTTDKSIVWMNFDVWCGLEQSTFDEAIDQWRGRHRVCVHAKGGHYKYSL